MKGSMTKWILIPYVAIIKEWVQNQQEVDIIEPTN